MHRILSVEEARKQLENEPDKKVVTFRNENHVFEESKDVLVENRSKRNENAFQAFVRHVFGFAMVNYLWYFIPTFILFYILYALGYWYIPVILIAAYIPSYISGEEHRGGRPWDWFRMMKHWKNVQRTLQIEVVRTAKLDPSKHYMFGLYPHGILVLSRCTIYGGVFESLFPGLDCRTLGASPMFYVPFGCREICLWLGAANASRKSAEKIAMKYKKSIIVYPGGTDEIFTTNPDSPETKIILRRGFIRLAIRAGMPIVPGFIFGEKKAYHRWFPPAWIRDLAQRLMRMPLIVFWGRWFTVYPYPVALTVVYGKPIEVEQQAEPSDEYVEKIFQQYVSAIQDLYQTHKSKVGYSNEEFLTMIDKEKERAERKKQHQAEKAKKQL